MSIDPTCCVEADEEEGDADEGWSHVSVFTGQSDKDALRAAVKSGAEVT